MSYQVYGDGNREFTSNNAYDAADVALTWKKNGLRPKLWVVDDPVGSLQVREMKIAGSKKILAGYLVTLRNSNKAKLKRRNTMRLKIDEIKIHSNDKLVKYDDGSFKYFDSYGSEIEILDADTLYSWMAEEQIEVSDELKAWIDE